MLSLRCQGGRVTEGSASEGCEDCGVALGGQARLSGLAANSGHENPGLTPKWWTGQ